MGCGTSPFRRGLLSYQTGHISMCALMRVRARSSVTPGMGRICFPKVRGKHLSNLELVRDDPDWVDVLLGELRHKRFSERGSANPRVVPGLGAMDHLSPWAKDWLMVGGQAVRIHDSGDFFSREYLDGWRDPRAPTRTSCSTRTRKRSRW
jgi:hypothetical protein